MPTPLVSAIVDTFNHEEFVEQALNSVLGQGFSPADLEILVVDDGSTDRTLEVLRKFADRVRILQKQNGGQASAFNEAIPQARGEIVAFLDGDDWWASGKLSRVVEVFEKEPGVGVVGHGYYEYDQNTGRSVTVVPGCDQLSLNSVEDGRNFRNLMSFLGTSRVSIRKSLLGLVGLVPAGLVIEADEFMSTMAVAKSGARLLREPLTFYRLHDRNLYQFRDSDARKVRRKMQVLAELNVTLRRELTAARLEEKIVDAVIQPIDVEAQRLRLSLDGGAPWETFQVERLGMRLAYSRMNWKYSAFKLLVLTVALIVPPTSFYKLRVYYAKMNLRRLRRFTGEPVPATTAICNESREDAK
jgi:glycosyltransferase involved in cell wall biosynthesis